MEVFIELLIQSLMITLVVLMLMLLIEYVNVLSKGKWLEKFSQRKMLQLIIAVFFGLLPGCAGSYLWVTLYTHGTVNFGSILANFIATTGDESYVMLSLFPEKALLLLAGLFVLATVVGWITNVLYSKNFQINTHFELHENDVFHEQGFIKCCITNLRQPSFERIFILFILLLLSVALLFLPDHSHQVDSNVSYLQVEGYIKKLLGGLALLTFFLSMGVNDHFLLEHVWKHVFKKHFFRLLLWVFATMLVLYFLYQAIDIERWINNNLYIVLILAVLIGIIPESGPHMIFVTLFANNIIPFPILMANSIVQEGHAGLPLLAESARSFMMIKLIKVILALTYGFISLSLL
ncbi:MAG: putative manganese transporter [Bacteroidales bacterium]|nr:putative manganese transporter [Bacteroidales bacterium]